MPLGCGLWHYGSRKILSLSSACLLRSPQATRLRLQKSTKFSCWSNPCPLGSGILPTSISADIKHLRAWWLNSICTSSGVPTSLWSRGSCRQSFLRLHSISSSCMWKTLDISAERRRPGIRRERELD
ncbi:uncharacterized protein [Nicotiana tomentosiformis]|uniref:uncharacterized protein isoform X2 n=1 Tax=Nicotiana tomentosiformis TaxID=4098 RepID=UPI00388CA506